MKMLPALALALSLGLGSAAVLHAQDTPGEKPADKIPTVTKPVRTPRLSGVWAKMGSLTPEQKQQIGALHKQALADKKAIEEKEEADIMALLSPEQKAEVEKLKDDGTASRKRKPADTTPATPVTPSTQPTEGGM